MEAASVPLAAQVAQPAVPASTVGAGNDAELARLGIPVPASEVEPALDPNPAPAKPDITKAQLVGSVPVIAKLLSAFGVYTLSGAQQEALTLALGSGAVLFLADAIIRHGRAVGLGKK